MNSYMCVNVDGERIFDGHLGMWTKEPPNGLLDRIKPGTTPAPYMKAVMMAITDAALQDESLQIDVTTEPNGWNMRVRVIS